MFFIAEGVTELVITAYSSSVPAPPSKLSPEFRVCRLEVDKPASKVSLPEVPVKKFVPVVSVKVEPATVVEAVPAATTVATEAFNAAVAVAAAKEAASEPTEAR